MPSSDCRLQSRAPEPDRSPSPVEWPEEGQFELVAADTGQGTAVLVRTRRPQMLYDAGPTYSPEADAASRVLLPLLRGSRRFAEIAGGDAHTGAMTAAGDVR